MDSYLKFPNGGKKVIKNRNELAKNESEKHDQEWIQLIKEAKKLGLTMTEIRNFLQKEESYKLMKLSRKKANLHHIQSI